MKLCPPTRLPSLQGGSSWGRAALFHKHIYGVNSMQASAEKIQACMSAAPLEDAVVVMAHNEPAGLGSEVNSICGKDWSSKAGETLCCRHQQLHSCCAAGCMSQDFDHLGNDCCILERLVFFAALEHLGERGQGRMYRLVLDDCEQHKIM